MIGSLNSTLYSAMSYYSDQIEEPAYDKHLQTECMDMDRVSHGCVRDKIYLNKKLIQLFMTEW